MAGLEFANCGRCTSQVLWSQGRPAIALIEEVLLEAGGQRVGGPPAPSPGTSGWLPAAAMSSAKVAGAAHVRSAAAQRQPDPSVLGASQPTGAALLGV
jgi:hypothetical protein